MRTDCSEMPWLSSTKASMSTVETFMTAQSISSLSYMRWISPSRCAWIVASCAQHSRQERAKSAAQSKRQPGGGGGKAHRLVQVCNPLDEVFRSLDALEPAAAVLVLHLLLGPLDRP